MSLDVSRGRSGRAASPSSRQAEQGQPLPLLVAGGLAGATAAVLSVMTLGAIALVAWMLSPGAPLEWSDMLVAAAGGYLTGQGIPVEVDGITLSLAPIGFGLLAAALVYLAARWAAGASAAARVGEGISVAVSCALGFGLVNAMVAVLSRQLGASPVVALLVGVALALVVAGIAVARALGVGPGDRMPLVVRDSLAGGIAGVALLLAAGGLAVLSALLLNLADIGLLLGELQLDLAGAVLLTVLSLAYLPVGVIWGAAYIVGPGFSIASDSVIAPLSDAAPSTLPGLPMLAALPGEAPAFGIALPVVAVGAGAMVGWLLRRRGYHGTAGIAPALASAAVAGFVMAILARVASGGLGADRLAAMGPSPLLVGLMATGLIALGAVAVVPWSRVQAPGEADERE